MVSDGCQGTMCQSIHAGMPSTHLASWLAPSFISDLHRSGFFHPGFHVWWLPLPLRWQMQLPQSRVPLHCIRIGRLIKVRDKCWGVNMTKWGRGRQDETTLLLPQSEVSYTFTKFKPPDTVSTRFEITLMELVSIGWWQFVRIEKSTKHNAKEMPFPNQFQFWINKVCKAMITYRAVR